MPLKDSYVKNVAIPEPLEFPEEIYLYKSNVCSTMGLVWH
jgi:hypothetical protein